MHWFRAVLCVSVVLAAHPPVSLQAQAAISGGSPSNAGTALKLVIPSSLRVSSLGVSSLGVASRKPVTRVSRSGWQDAARAGQPVPVVLPSDSTTGLQSA